jgi:hypothetical protein
MRTEVATSHLRVMPGVAAVLDVEVTNTSDVIDGVTATINGLDQAWVSLVTPVVSLFPESSATLSLRIDLPRNCLAGEYLVSVHVTSIIDPERFSDHEFWLSVDPLAAASLVMHPNLVIGGSEATFLAEITNEGNITTELIVSAFDETRELNAIASPSTVSLPAGETHSVSIDVRGKRPFFGQSVTRVIKVGVSGEGIELEAPANFTQKPRILRGVLTILILVLIIALWATVFLVVVSALRDKPAETKAPAENFNKRGNGTVNLAAIAASMTGTVTAQSSGLPVPLITVEALRIKPDGSLDSVGSTSTGDDGTYTLEALLPGRYKLHFTGEGFDELWYPAAADSGSATEVRVDPAGKAEGLGAVVVGKPGSLGGQIIAPETTGTAAAVTVTVTQVIDKPKEGEPLPTPVTVPVDATGNFAVPNLVTPATYAVDIASTKFNPRHFSETLAAGENRVLNTVTLGAAIGKITGTVVGSDGIPLGNVEITARSGDVEKATKTPTSGAVGQFVVDALETPNTYVLTFHLEGYDDQTIALDLGPGEDRVINVQLLGGTGTVAGLATDSTGLPLGGAPVTISRGEFSATTATLTDSGPAGQPGAFAVTGLPTPGSYTVTVSSPGYISQVVRVDLGSAGSATGLVVALPKATGVVAGAVTASGANTATSPVADVVVELSDGGTPRTTASASSPAGAFRFNDVAPGSYTLTFRKKGFATRVVIINVVADQTVTRNVDLAVAS